jgi:hypothetical protein
MVKDLEEWKAWITRIRLLTFEALSLSSELCSKYGSDSWTNHHPLVLVIFHTVIMHKFRSSESCLSGA